MTKASHNLEADYLGHAGGGGEERVEPVADYHEDNAEVYEDEVFAGAVTISQLVLNLKSVSMSWEVWRD